MSKYAAFISYRHGGIDEKVAIQIHKEMERYRLPGKIAKAKGTKSLGKIFRDAEELRAASNLSEIIREAIRESEWLIVLCTKRYKESVWCMEEIEYFIKEYTNNNITDYQAAALVMAIYINGMTDEETKNLTLAMANSGDTLDLSDISNTIIDKHSSGGVGDKITLIVMPIVASLGVPVAKMSGRGLRNNGWNNR